MPTERFSNLTTSFHDTQNVRFPPRKARLQNGQGGAHSPISPFTPTSPLYPDGLMAPIWIRKHRELIPSAFVLVLRLYEFGAPLDDGTPDVTELEIGPLEKEKVERLRDNELVNEVMNRKRVCNERGIKLAVVLLASRELLGKTIAQHRLWTWLKLQPHRRSSSRHSTFPHSTSQRSRFARFLICPLSCAKSRSAELRCIVAERIARLQPRLLPGTREKAEAQKGTPSHFKYVREHQCFSST